MFENRGNSDPGLICEPRQIPPPVEPTRRCRKPPMSSARIWSFGSVRSIHLFCSFKTRIDTSMHRSAMIITCTEVIALLDCY